MHDVREVLRHHASAAAATTAATATAASFVPLMLLMLLRFHSRERHVRVNVQLVKRVQGRELRVATHGVKKPPGGVTEEVRKATPYNLNIKPFVQNPS